MQTIYKDENEKWKCRRIGIVGVNIYTEKISRYLEKIY